MTGLHRVVVVVPEHVEKRKVTTVYPPTTLGHQLLVRLHRVRVRKGVRYVLQVVLPVLLTVDPQTQDPVLSQIHIRLHVVLFFMVRVQNHLEVLPLQQVLLEFLPVDQRLVPVSRPCTWQHVQKTQHALETLVDEVRYYVLELLCLLYRKKTVLHKSLLRLLLTFFRLEVCVHTHESRHSPNVLVLE
jgi:hypothetical protein